MFTCRSFEAALRLALGKRGAALGSILVIGASATTNAVAAPDQEPIRLEYVADSGCPSATDFERMVFERTHSARPALGGESARLFSVTLQRRAQTIHGSLTVREGEQSLVRKVNGGDCSDLASVLALATALAIDPSAELLPLGTTKERPTDSMDEATPTPGAVSNANRPLQPMKPPESGEPPPFDPPDALPRGAATKVLQVALGPRMEWAATPFPAVGPSLAIEFGSEERTWTLGIAASLLLTPTKDVATARADFRILTASLSVCGLAFRWQNWVQAGPCLQADFGDVYASATNIPYRQSTHRFWSTLGVHLELLTQLSQNWNLALDIGPNLVLTQYRFEFNEPDVKVFQQGSWTGSARLMLGRRF